MRLFQILSFIFLLSFSANCTDFNSYNEILIKTFNIGDKENELGYLTGDDAWGTSEIKPSAITFNKDDNLIITDTINKRIVYYDKKITVKKIIRPQISIWGVSYLTDQSNIIWGTNSGEIYDLINKNNNISRRISILKSLKEHSKNVITDRVLFFYLEDGSIGSIILEDKNNLQFSKTLTEHETLDLFKNKKEFGLDNYSIDSKKRIYFNGKIQNNDYATMYAYWNELHKKNNEVQPREVPGVPAFDELKEASPDYIGEDNDGNTYMGNNDGCIIFDRNGWVLDYFIFDNSSFILPAVNSIGDVFYLAIDESGELVVINLYKIERQW